MEFDRLRRLSINFFLLIWLLSFLLIGSRDLLDYRLQSIGVDAWATFGTAEVGLSSSAHLKPAGDVFEYNGKLFPAKQPGQFVLGAVFYSVIKILGWSFENNYLLAAGLVAALTSCFFTALAAVMLLRHLILVHRVGQAAACLVVANTFIGSQWYVYSSISHHDILAGCTLLMAIILLDPKLEFPSYGKLLFSGLLLGLTLFTSMLPAALVAAIIGYCFFASIFIHRRHLLTLLGFGIGVAPIFIYNVYYFESPWTPPNIAGGYSDTYPTLDPIRILHHANMYLGYSGLSQALYSPISYLMLVASVLLGIASLPKLLGQLSKAATRAPPLEMVSDIYQQMLCWAVTLHFLYICSIETLGTCSYGPRYLLPVLPIACYIFTCKASLCKLFFKPIIFSTLLIYGFSINLVGKLFGSIVCNLDEFSFLNHLRNSPALSASEIPLAPLAMLFLLYGCIYIAYRQPKLGVVAPSRNEL